MKDLRSTNPDYQMGFTLVEILLALAIGTIILAALSVATFEGHRSSTGIEQKIAVQQDARAALSLMEIEIGMASFHPRGKAAWGGSLGCAPQSLAANRGIRTATGSMIVVESDLNSNGVVAAGDPNEIVIYNYVPAENRLTREVSCGGAQPFLGGTSADPVANNVLIQNSDYGVPVFRYYDGSGALIADPNNTIANIHRIEITLIIQSASRDTSGQQRIMTYTTSVIPRNHRMPETL